MPKLGPEQAVPAIMAPPPTRDNPLTRSLAGVFGLVVLGVMVLACLGSLPWTMGSVAGIGGAAASPRYDVQNRAAGILPPTWWPAEMDPEEAERYEATGRAPYLFGTDLLGRSLFVRVLTGGGISLMIGIAAATLSVFLGTLYGALSGYVGGKTDAVMMRIVDILFGLPYILLVVLLAVASDAVIDEYVTRQHARTDWVYARVEPKLHAAGDQDVTKTDLCEYLEQHADEDETLRVEAARLYPSRNISRGTRITYDLLILIVAIGGVSWLTMARVVRGQVLSLKNQPFMEAARAMGVPVRGLFLRHLVPNLLGPIVVYGTLTVPQAILQESFLSFLGIGVRPPIPSWGNLAAEGLTELNPYKSHWWMLLFPCLMLGVTLLALNFVGEGLREALDPRRARRG